MAEMGSNPGQSGQHSQQSRRGEERAGVAETVFRQEFRETLDRIDTKLDRLDEKIEQAVEKRVSKEEYSATVAALEKRIERLEASPQRTLVFFGAGVAILSLLVSAFWVLLWVIEHAHP